jgi:hypothetical protein
LVFPEAARTFQRCELSTNSADDRGGLTRHLFDAGNRGDRKSTPSVLSTSRTHNCDDEVKAI